jgi:hypothetical protein
MPSLVAETTVTGQADAEVVISAGHGDGGAVLLLPLAGVPLPAGR